VSLLPISGSKMSGCKLLFGTLDDINVLKNYCSHLIITIIVM
jgi:hypothetical protein